MSRRSRLVQAMARYSARCQDADRARGDTPLTTDRYAEARWRLAALDAPSTQYPTRLVRRWNFQWGIHHGRRLRGGVR